MSFNPSQIQAINHFKGPALILAGPGSGKTLVITHRTKKLIEDYHINPSRILVITFTKAAAREMKERFVKLMGGSLPVSFGTFHGIFFKILKYAYGLDVSNIISEEQKYQWFRELVQKCELDVEDEKEFLSGISAEISQVKGERLSLDHYYGKSCSQEVFGYLYQSYESRLRKERKIDFDDMLVMTLELFEKRPDILAAWQKKYQYLLIDEFQDINRTQYQVMRLLAKPENNLFIVGDDDQSIYRFRGARPEIMLNFKKQYPEAAEILLNQNYRSTKQIVQSALTVIQHNTRRFQKQIITENSLGEPIDIRCFQSPTEENRELIGLVQSYREKGFEYSDMAVLYRTNTDARLLAEYLMEYNIPFRMKDALPNLYDHWIAQDVLTYIKIAMGSKKRSDYLRIINRPKRYIARDCLDTPEISLERLETFYEDKKWMLDRIQDLRHDLDFLRDLPPFGAVSYIRRAIGYEDYLREYARSKNIKIEELITILDQLQESAESYHSFDEWFFHMEEYKEQLKNQAKDREQEKNALELSTLHSSKGLEYSIVFLIDANERVMPHHKAVLDEDIEEERRLFYVGMTRAKERLHIFYTRERYNKEMEVSRFVAEMAGEDL